MPTVSIVIPVYNEEEVLPALFEALAVFFDTFDDLQFEAILVDDGSTDGSWQLMGEQHTQDVRFRMVRLSRNFGHQMALTAGLDESVGDAAVVMDADLQDPLDVVRQMIEEWRDGREIVYGQRTSRRGDTWFKRTTALVFYGIMRVVSRDRTPWDVGDFYLLSGEALAALRAMREPNRYLRGMVFWLGFEPIGIPYERQRRTSGVTKFSYQRMLVFALDALLSSSTYPLILASGFGLLVAGVSGFLAVWGLFRTGGGGGQAAFVLFAMAVQLGLLGVLGLYLSRVYYHVKGRPLYVVRERCGEAANQVGQGRDDAAT
jgi:polyisoprenyl-phosphate glycosyltransferase